MLHTFDKERMATSIFMGFVLLTTPLGEAAHEAEEVSGDLEIANNTSTVDVYTAQVFTITADYDVNKLASRTTPYNESTATFTEEKHTNGTTRYNELLTTAAVKPEADGTTLSTPDSEHDGTVQMTHAEITVTTVAPTRMDNNSAELSLYLFLATAMVAVLLIIIVLLYLRHRHKMDIRSLFRLIVSNLMAIITCKYRCRSTESSGMSSSKQTNRIDDFECYDADVDDWTGAAAADRNNYDDGGDESDDNGGQNGYFVPTESVPDFSKTAKSTDEENEEIIICEAYVTVPSNPVPRDTYVGSFNAHDLDQHNLKNEFDAIRKWSKQLPYSKLHGKLEINRGKNRYLDVIPFDYNRVPLYGKPGTKGLELYESMSPEEKKEIRYINASYIREFGDKSHNYIATQGPLSGTISDFWEMIWQEESDMIIMLTSLKERGKTKCERYWPHEKGSNIRCGEISVKLLVSEKYAYHDCRRLEITKAGVKRQVHHYLYHHWPDKEAPDMVLPILNLYRKVFLQGRHKTGPVIAHCSAGVGRTGTFISLHYVQEQAKRTNSIDIMACVAELRRQRVNMVQRVSQYMFLYEAVHEALEVGQTMVPASEFGLWFQEAQKDEESIIVKQFKLMDAKRPSQPPDDELVGLEPENKDKNRDFTIIPDPRKIAYLSTFIKGRNGYINAVYVDTFRETNAVVVTQLPLEDTICDFWRLVYDSSSTTIVLLEDMIDMPEHCPVYWPDDGEEAIYSGVMAVSGKLNRELSTERITVRDFNVLTKPDGYYSIDVRMLQLNTWPRGTSLLPDKLDLIELINMTEKYKRNASAVQCLDGCERSGLFCACMYIMDQIQRDEEVDIYQATRIITASRPQFIRNVEQYKYLYEFALECVKVRSRSFPAIISSAIQRRNKGKCNKSMTSPRARTKSAMYNEDATGFVSNLIKGRTLFRSENELKEAAKKRSTSIPKTVLKTPKGAHPERRNPCLQNTSTSSTRSSVVLNRNH